MRMLLFYWVLFPSIAFASTLNSTSFDSALQGSNPAAALIEGSDGNFYGATVFGGSSNEGTVFRMSPSGSLTTIVNFTGPNGAYPSSSLIRGSDGNFYGTTPSGGSSDQGTAYKLTPSGTLTTLVNFTGDNGSHPEAALIQGRDGNFYGTTSKGDGSNFGTVFKLTPSGTLTTLANFTNANGAFPQAGLVQGSDGNFYGMTSSGGYSGYGTVFELTPSGTLTTVVGFTSANGPYPQGGLVQGSDGNFYGTTYRGGAWQRGTVFKLTPSGTLTTLVDFYGDNGDSPTASLIQASDGNFYGTTSDGAPRGTVFKLTPSGTLTTLVNFYVDNGDSPIGNLTQGSDGSFYGTTSLGGTSVWGTVFRLNLSTTESVTFDSSTTIPFVSSSYIIAGSSLKLTLGFAPSLGTVLTLVQNSGFKSVVGTFTNLPDGGSISATYNGVKYVFTANYSGGDGNDLTLALTGITQTITFPPIADHMYGAAPFTIEATASSGLPVYYTTSGPVKIAGNTVTITGAGKIAIRAHQDGSAPYSSAPSVLQSFTVAPAAQTITFAPIADRKSTDAPFTLGATASSGLAVTYKVMSGPATISGNTLTLTGTGVVTVQANQTGNINYLPASNVAESFVVTQGIKSQTVTFPAISDQPFTNAPIALNATSSSGLPITYSATGPVKISGNAATLTGLGTVRIRATQSGNANYSSTNVLNSFTVIQGSQTITFPTIAAQTYGAVPFDLAATASSGLPVIYTLLSGPATLSGTNKKTVTITGVGTIIVQASQAGNTNFAAAPNANQSITVAKAAQTVTFPTIPNQSYPSPSFALNANASSGLPIAYSATGPVKLSAGVATLTGTGTVRIRATQSGNDNYESANVLNTFTVTASP